MYNHQLDSMKEQNLFGREMKKDEQLLWSGKPVFKPVSSLSAIFPMVFGVIWLAMLSPVIKDWIPLSASDHSHRPPLIFILFNIPFVLIGLAFIIGPVIYSLLWYRNTYYAVTSQRVIMLRTGLLKKFSSIRIKSLDVYEKYSFADGMGTIVFGSYPMPAYLGPISGSGTVPAFICVPDVDGVYNTIESLVEKSAVENAK